MKQRNSFTSNDKQTGRRPADMLDIYKYIWSDLCEAYNRTVKFRRTFLSLQLRSTKIVGWPYPVGEVCVTAWHVTSRNQGLSSNDQGRQRRETLGTRLVFSMETPCWSHVGAMLPRNNADVTHCEKTVFYFQNKVVYRAEDRRADICLKMTSTWWR